MFINKSPAGPILLAPLPLNDNCAILNTSFSNLISNGFFPYFHSRAPQSTGCRNHFVHVPLHVGQVVVVCI